MGHSASIARKYQPRHSGGHGNYEVKNDDDRDSLATVSSYRPTSPLAHTDAQQFSFSPQDRPPSRTRYTINGSIPNGSLGYNGSLGNRRYTTPSSSTLGTPHLQSMRDVNHFLVKNPELLNRKKTKRTVRKEGFDDIENHKQIKTKQDLYLEFFDPPTIYGKGVDPEKQLKINQRVYLQLIHPTYGQQYYKPYRPLVPDNMIVVRKDDAMKRAQPRERTRPPLKGMEVTRASPASLMASQRHTPSRQYPHASQRSMSRSMSPQIPNGHVLPSSTPMRGTPMRGTPRRRGNEYIDMPSSSLKMNTHGSRLSKLNPDLMEVERRFESPASSLGRSAKYEPKQDDIVFDYTVEELGLKKKTRSSQRSQPKDTPGAVEPLYFRKSLAYNPRYSNRGNVLSDPL